MQYSHNPIETVCIQPVMTILWLIEWMTGFKDNALYHIDGNLNLANLLTKKHDIGVEDVSRGSQWIKGLQ